MIMKMEWDSSFFQIKCGRCVLSNDEIDVDAFVNELKEYDFVSIQNENNSGEVNALLGKYTTAFLADVNMQLKKEVEASYNADAQIKIIPANVIKKELIDKLTVDESDFMYSKFVCDAQFKRRNGYMVYKKWIENSYTSTNKYFALKFINDIPVGFIIFNVTDKVSTVELVKVDKEYTGMHIATDLLAAIENYVFDMGVLELKVGTQLNNIPAINLYHKYGFKEISRTSVYHYWNANLE